MSDFTLPLDIASVDITSQRIDTKRAVILTVKSKKIKPPVISEEKTRQNTLADYICITICRIKNSNRGFII